MSGNLCIFVGMLENRLDKDLIQDASLYVMLVRLSRTAVDVVIYSPLVDNSLIYRSFPTAGADGEVRALENVVYDNPLMLADFRSRIILTDSPRWSLCPSEWLEDGHEAADAMLRIQWPDMDGTVHTAPTTFHGVEIAYSVDSRMAGFVQRTFPGTIIEPHILPLLRYCSSRMGRANSRRMLVNLRQSDADIVVADGASLRQGVTVSFNTTADLLYRILSSAQAAGLDPRADELLLCGSRSMREELTPMLRTYHARVMPVIFPPEMFRAGREAMNAPFDLIITPLTHTATRQS